MVPWQARLPDQGDAQLPGHPQGCALGCVEEEGGGKEEVEEEGE